MVVVKLTVPEELPGLLHRGRRCDWRGDVPVTDGSVVAHVGYGRMVERGVVIVPYSDGKDMVCALFTGEEKCREGDIEPRHRGV